MEHHLKTMLLNPATSPGIVLSIAQACFRLEYAGVLRAELLRLVRYHPAMPLFVLEDPATWKPILQILES